MKDSTKPVVLELGIEFIVELLLFLYPYGAEQMDLPHNFYLGLGCWIVGTAIAVRMFWIFPLWSDRLSRLEKGLCSLLFLAIFVGAFYRPVMTAYAKRNKGTNAIETTSAQPATPAPAQQSPKSEPQAQPSQGQSKPRPRKTAPSTSQETHGDNSPNVNQNSQGANSQNVTTLGDNSPVTINNSSPPPPVFHEKSDVAYFSLGEHGLIIAEPVANMRNGEVGPIQIDGYVPVKLRMKEDTLLLHFTVWGGQDKPPIEVKDNDFTVRLLGFDRNSNANALEVINPKGEPIFQLIRKEPAHIAVNGIFPSPFGLILAGPDGMIAGATQSSLVAFHLKPIFKYPAWKYPGEYAN